MDLNKVLAAAEEDAKGYGTKSDAVRWTAWEEDGTEVGKWEKTICYAGAMGILPKLRIRCEPYKGTVKGAAKDRLSSKQYLEFFELLKQHCLVPPDIEATDEEGSNCLVIPRSGWDRHTIYIALCYYRQCDQQPGEIVRAMSLYQRLKDQGTHFLQCLHYAAATTKFGSGHYFMNFGPYDGGMGKLNLASGKALAWFASLSKEQRLEECPIKNPAGGGRGYDSRYTYTFLTKRAKKEKSVEVKNLVEILDPKYAEHYENPKLKE